MPVTKTTPNEILRSAWRVFHTRGYKNTSLQQLADTAGLGKAGLLHHFGSKAGLMKAVIDYALNWYEYKVLSLADDETLSVENRLENILNAQFNLVQLNEGGGCFFGNMSLETGDGPFADQLRGFHEKWTATATRLLSERFPEEEAAERAYRIFLDYQGSVMMYKLYKDPLHLERLIKRTLASLNAELITA